MTMEFLQVIHLTKQGKVFNLDLSGMETRIMNNGAVTEQGKGIQPHVDEHEFLLSMVRLRIVHRASAVATKLLLFNSVSMMPATVFIGTWGEQEPTKGSKFWHFPQLDAVTALHRIMTEGG